MHSQARAFIYELHSRARAINTVIDTLCVQLPYIISIVQQAVQQVTYNTLYSLCRVHYLTIFSTCA